MPGCLSFQHLSIARLVWYKRSHSDQSGLFVCRGDEAWWSVDDSKPRIYSEAMLLGEGRHSAPSSMYLARTFSFVLIISIHIPHSTTVNTISHNTLIHFTSTKSKNGQNLVFLFFLILFNKEWGGKKRQ